jgi:hypothetical protein
VTDLVDVLRSFSEAYPVEEQSVAKKSKARHPIQPLECDDQGVIRFKSNAIVRHLLDNYAKGNLNELARVDFPSEDWEQFHQLIGYSHSGIPNVSEELWQSAEAMYKAGISELEARCNFLSDELDALKAGLREPIARLYSKHPDDFE